MLESIAITFPSTVSKLDCKEKKLVYVILYALYAHRMGRPTGERSVQRDFTPIFDQIGDEVLMKTLK